MKADPARQLLRNVRLRVTTGRVALIEVLLAADSPLSMDDAKDQCGDAGGDRTTVYRNLLSLCEAGLVRVVRGAGRRDVYELAVKTDTDHVHAHLVCTECGILECVEETAPPRAKTLPRAWKVESSEMTYFGVCPECDAPPPAAKPRRRAVKTARKAQG